MKKRIYFDKTVDLESRKFYVVIHDGKVREYHGINLVTVFVVSMIPNPNRKKGDLEFKSFEMNADFKLIKVGKYDKKKYQIKAKYKIECKDLSDLTMKDAYVRLNFLERFIIDYDKKDTVFHRIKLKQQIVTTLFVAIPTAIIIMLFGLFFKKDNNQSSNPSVNKVYNDTVIELKKEKPINRNELNKVQKSDTIYLTPDITKENCLIEKKQVVTKVKFHGR